MSDDAQPLDAAFNSPSDAGGPSASQDPANENTPTPQLPAAPQQICSLKVGELDERGNTVKYIYACDQDYVVYYSRLEYQAANANAKEAAAATGRRSRLLPFTGRSSKSAALPGYECEGVQAQLSSDPVKRHKLRSQLLPLGTERAKLQALLSGWPRRQSYDSSIAIALQLALDGDGTADARAHSIQALQDAKVSILDEREIAGKAQYVRFTVLLGLLIILLLVTVQHNLFKGSGNFWLGAQAGVIGAVLSIAISIRNRTVALDIGMAGNLADSALRLIIGAVSGGTLVLVFATGLLPSLHTLQGEQNGAATMQFALLLGIIAGFVEQLVPSLLEDQAHKFRGNDTAAQPPQAATPAKTAPAPAVPI